MGSLSMQAWLGGEPTEGCEHSLNAQGAPCRPTCTQCSQAGTQRLGHLPDPQRDTLLMYNVKTSDQGQSLGSYSISHPPLQIHTYSLTDFVSQKAPAPWPVSSASPCREEGLSVPKLSSFEGSKA